MDIDLLETSLTLVDLPDDGLTLHFYDVLFTRYPDVRPMFSADIKPQAAMLHQALAAVLEHISDSAWLGDTLGTLGKKHAGWGVTAPMYDAVTECMLATFQELGGEQWTPPMTQAWTEALGAVASLMLAGAEA
ncbi:MAG: hypothetical protein KAG80_00855 [Nocardioides sp.]|nr:hypothetical protein [Nocardioides sp.]